MPFCRKEKGNCATSIQTQLYLSLYRGFAHTVEGSVTGLSKLLSREESKMVTTFLIIQLMDLARRPLLEKEREEPEVFVNLF